MPSFLKLAHAALAVALLSSGGCDADGSDGGKKPVCQSRVANGCPVACSCPEPSSCLARREPALSRCITDCTDDPSLCAKDEICVAASVFTDGRVIVGECRPDCSSEPCPPGWAGCDDLARFDSGEYLYEGAAIAILGGERVNACDPY